MSARFLVTFEIVTEESAAAGDVAFDGFIGSRMGLRDALEAVQDTRGSNSGVECVECDSSPATDPRWVTVTNGRDWDTGEHESRSLHMPETLTASTRRRIARLVGARVP